MLHLDQLNDSLALLDSNGQPIMPTRRAAIKAALGVGYAASVMPIMAQTAIRTSSEGLVTGEISFEVNGFKVPAYRAAPAGKSNLPVVLVIQEIFGVHEYIADVARRLAQAGYLAIAPELFARQGDPTSYGEIAKLQDEIVSKVPDAQVLADLDGAVQWAGSHGGNLTKLGITGFCWGGRQTWLYSAHNKNIKAGVAWYGRLVGANSPMTPRHPVDIAADLKGPVLGLYGGADTGIAMETVSKMQTALASGSVAAKASEFVVYPNMPHAFHADYRPSYRREAADDGWLRALAWLRRHGLS